MQTPWDKINLTLDYKHSYKDIKSSVKVEGQLLVNEVWRPYHTLFNLETEIRPSVTYCLALVLFSSALMPTSSKLLAWVSKRASGSILAHWQSYPEQQ